MDDQMDNLTENQIEDMLENGEKIDRRILRTRKSIMEAFDKLLTEQETGKMTVSAIAREADIDRKTFYLHYDSIEDLVNHMIAGSLERLIAVIRQHGIEKPSHDSLHVALEEVNRILMSDLELYERVAAMMSIDQLLEFCGSTAVPAIEHTNFSPDIVRDRKAEMRLQFYTAGALALYSTWLKTGHEEPIETVSDAIERAVIYD